jgi:hypothetical protein
MVTTRSPTTTAPATAGLAPNGSFDFQTDGNLVIYNAAGQPVWAASIVHS